jgi:hypothetical protein
MLKRFTDFLRPAAMIECSDGKTYVIETNHASFSATFEGAGEEAIEQARTWCRKNGYRVESVNGELVPT